MTSETHPTKQYYYCRPHPNDINKIARFNGALKVKRYKPRLTTQRAPIGLLFGY